ncbi:hypothetical protein [Paenibacillus oceani]|uniref:Uncharacterized protein n=1 Tax=Paenibacillus oceani TaxID=2772510 RepID=A0A927CHT0_9BACL|nr:hypothetical protein [Paenibacillus oceani]MBD2865990.1 hypothetical protein [Paenibacillus oceani]
MENSMSIIAFGPIIMFLLINVIFFAIVAVIVKRAAKPDKIIAELKLVKMQLRELQETIVRDQAPRQAEEQETASQ